MAVFNKILMWAIGLFADFYFPLVQVFDWGYMHSNKDLGRAQTQALCQRWFSVYIGRMKAFLSVISDKPSCGLTPPRHGRVQRNTWNNHMIIPNWFLVIIEHQERKHWNTDIGSLHPALSRVIQQNALGLLFYKKSSEIGLVCLSNLVKYRPIIL